MKYVVFVLFTFMSPDNEIERTQFEIEMPNRQACLDAQAKVEKDVIEKYPNALALTVECRPQTPWDEPISMIEFKQGEGLVAAE